ncbi:MAG: GNAT family N-acetyltransferase [Clostridiales bacterium]|jgi:ribosomal-protein-alanine N-acetyltransferase|nr:GNAT family N-acetyltransferase [Clostridiales bacterium]
MAFKDYFRDFQSLIANDNIFLRQIIVEKDFDDYYEIYSNDEVFKLYGGGRGTTDKSVVLKILQNQIKEFKTAKIYSWTIVDNKYDKAIGRIFLSDFQAKNRIANIGYFINRSYWGKGIVTECVSSVVDFGFSFLKLERIFTEVATDNIGSCKVLAKNGFIQEGILRHCFELKDSLVDCYVYSKLSTD